MELVARTLLEASKAPGTTAAYKTAVTKFDEYCRENKVHITNGIDVQALRGFVAYLATPTPTKRTGLRYSTVQSYLTGVKSWALDQGLTVPTAEEMGPVKKLVRGLKRIQHGRQGSSRLPVTIELCGLIKSVLDLDQHNHRVFWAMLATGVRGLFRLGELTVDNTTSQNNKDKLLHQSDLSTFKEEACKGHALQLRVSKTDPFRESTTVYLFFTNDTVCASSALHSMIRQSPFTRSASTPLFALDNGEPLLRPKFIELLQQCIRLVNKKFSLNFDYKRFSGHSIRRGGATSLATMNVPDHVIQTMGRWKSNSHRIYISTPRARLFQATSRLNKITKGNKKELVAACLKSLTKKPYEPEVGGL